MLIPVEQLSELALRGLIEEFVSREGTDYGDMTYTLEQKVAQVQQQLRAGDVMIVFDAEQNSCSILPRKEAEQAISINR